MTVDEALEEAMRWARGQLSAPSLPARLTLVVPQPEPYVGLLHQRLRADAATAGLRVHIVGGLPLRGTSAGRRLRRLFDAVAAGGSAASLTDLLPFLRRGATDTPRGDAVWEPRMSRTRAAALVYETGADPSSAGPRRWAARVRARLIGLRREVDEKILASQTDVAARRTLTVERQQAERWLRDVTPLLAALDSLDQLVDQVEAGASLAALWDGVENFAAQWLHLPPDPADAVAAIGTDLRAQPATFGALRGHAGLAFLAGRLDAVRCATPAPHDADAVIVVADQPLPSPSGSTFRLSTGEDAERFTGARRRPRVVTSTVALPSGPPTASAVDSACLDTERVAALLAQRDGAAMSVADGDLRAVRSLLAIPGLSAARPLSASALGLLLSCPYRFLQQRLVHWNEPRSPPPTDSVEPISYGALFHAAADQLLRQAGPALCRQEGTLADWETTARAVADDCFDAVLRRYPLWGTANIERERQRLHAQLLGLVADEWRRGRREFLAAEWRFGEPIAVEIGAPEAPLYVRGSIDRVDVLPSGGLSLRDLKTGGLTDLDRQGLDVRRDLQLGVYVLVLEKVGLGGRMRVEEAAYVQPGQGQGSQRVFSAAPLQMLRRATAEWLGVAHALLATGLFPRTPNHWECRNCAFLPVCGEGAQARSAEKLRGLAPLQAFRRFKGVEGRS